MDATPFALAAPKAGAGRGTFNVVAYDFGIKRNILRRLVRLWMQGHGSAGSFRRPRSWRMHPDGIFLSNGPGDPAAVTAAIRNIQALIGQKPIFGICLGHQLLALALGGRTFKLKFGHRGGNHPVKNLLTGSSRSPRRTTGSPSIPNRSIPVSIEITHINLNDGTNEGFRHRDLPLFSVQYHPEASPGPHDSDYLFHDFVEMMKTGAPVSNPRPAGTVIRG